MLKMIKICVYIKYVHFCRTNIVSHWDGPHAHPSKTMISSCPQTDGAVFVHTHLPHKYHSLFLFCDMMGCIEQHYLYYTITPIRGSISILFNRRSFPHPDQKKKVHIHRTIVRSTILLICTYIT